MVGNGHPSPHPGRVRKPCRLIVIDILKGGVAGRPGLTGDSRRRGERWKETPAEPGTDEGGVTPLGSTDHAALVLPAGGGGTARCAARSDGYTTLTSPSVPVRVESAVSVTVNDWVPRALKVT